MESENLKKIKMHAGQHWIRHAFRNADEMKLYGCVNRIQPDLGVGDERNQAADFLAAVIGAQPAVGQPAPDRTQPWRAFRAVAAQDPARRQATIASDAFSVDIRAVVFGPPFGRDFLLCGIIPGLRGNVSVTRGAIQAANGDDLLHDSLLESAKKDILFLVLGD
jgi:hypothetical protein